MLSVSLSCLGCRSPRGTCDAIKEYKDDEWAVILGLAAVLKAQRGKDYVVKLPVIEFRTALPRGLHEALKVRLRAMNVKRGFLLPDHNKRGSRAKSASAQPTRKRKASSAARTRIQ